VPFLRVLRDKRGYETTYLMHWFREGNRQRSRVLYVFRTPGGGRVGRSPLERDVLREIERQYPDIQFDWTAVREHQQIIEPPPEYRRRKPARREEQEPETEAVPPPPPAAVPPVPVAVQPPSPRPQVPSVLEGATPDEQIAFLEGCYPGIRARVLHRSDEPARREALLALVERLNPAAWTDADQITAGLQGASETLERLSRVLSRRRRRGRRRSPAEAGDVAAPEETAAVDATDQDDNPS
jgi:hypothetical protein